MPAIPILLALISPARWYHQLMVDIGVHKDDITRIRVDAIVNAANTGLLGGGGVDGAIHRVGGPTIMDACQRIRQLQGGCSTGDAVITTAGNLPADYVIHTVGPVWKHGRADEKRMLRLCYENSLKLADRHRVMSISFPNISTGIYGFPKQNAAQIAIDAVLNYFEATNSSIAQLNFICFDNENYTIYQDIISEVSIKHA